jgi:hydrogenase-4 component B
VSAEHLILLGIALSGFSGVPGLFLGRLSSLGERLAALLMVVGCGCGLAGVAAFFRDGAGPELGLPSPVLGASFRVALDALSALFLVPIFVVSLLGSVYGLGYWKQADHPENGRKLRLFYGLLTASMALLVSAHSAILFLFAWEVMALAGYFLVCTEDHDEETRAAGWLYLAASHFATLCLFGAFALLAYLNGGSFSLVAPASAPPGIAAAVFLLAVLGFGTKAGVMPLHIWLPSAHAMAPSHVSALLSGVLIKVGIYGLVRICALLPAPPVWWGALLLSLGVVSGVLGVAFAVGQHDLKRLLAYHSIENIGIIVMGLGLAMLGRSLGRADWVVLGLAGALLHVWNHALFKALLFLSAGSVIHAARTREIDHLGGLARAMPYTSLAFLVGAAAICGLPPLNGFVSELLIYLGLFRTLALDPTQPSWGGASFAAPALALIGALAVACFVKVFGAVFLGAPRSAQSGGSHPRLAEPHEAGPLMLGPMAVLAAGCFFIGLAPPLVAPLLEQGVTAFTGAEFLANSATLADLAPLGWISLLAFALLGALALGAALLAWRLRRGAVGAAVTWDCGYAEPSPTMQYTSSSFAQTLVGLFAWALRPRTHAPRLTAPFPAPSAFHSEVDDPVLQEAVLPASRWTARLSHWLRIFQRGSIQTYILYIFLTLVLLLLWR